MEKITLIALILFAVTYVLMMVFQKIRPHIAVTSALVFIAMGIVQTVAPGTFGNFSFTPLEALKEVDWNVIMMIAGTMGTVYLFIESKMPQLMSDLLISRMPSVK